MREVSFRASEVDRGLIGSIVRRAVKVAKKHGSKVDPEDLEMDLRATHANGCPLDLPKLLAADDFNFTHDVFGIRRHIDRSTGELTDHFLPRCALPEGAR